MNLVRERHMKQDNRGFTLAELIVSMLIFSLVVAAAFGFMLSGANTYGRVTDRLDLQIGAQLAVNQVGSALMDCNTGFCFDPALSTLYIINSDESGYTAHSFVLRDGSLYYGKAPATLADNKFQFEIEADALLTRDVSDFSVAPNVGVGEPASSATVTLAFNSSSASYDGEQTVALRNKPLVATVEPTVVLMHQRKPQKGFSI